MKKVLVESLQALKSKKLWYSLGLDIVLIITLLLLSLITSTIFRNIQSKVDKNLIISLAVIYIIIVIASYSYFKYKILRMLHEIQTIVWTKFFTLTTIFIAIVLSIILIIYKIISYFINYEYQHWYFAVAFLIILCIGYAILNIMQALQVSEGKMKRTQEVFAKNFSVLALTASIEIIGIVVLYLIYFLLYVITQGTIEFAGIFQTLTLILLIFYNAFNRIIFYKAATGKEIGKK